MTDDEYRARREAINAGPEAADRLAEAYIRDDHVQHEEQEHLEMVCEHDCPACRELEAAEIAYRKVKG